MNTVEFRKTDAERGNSMNPENKQKLKRILICDSYSVFSETKHELTKMMEGIKGQELHM